jgi:hypothetical protein
MRKGPPPRKRLSPCFTNLMEVGFLLINYIFKYITIIFQNLLFLFLLGIGHPKSRVLGQMCKDAIDEYFDIGLFEELQEREDQELEEYRKILKEYVSNLGGDDYS